MFDDTRKPQRIELPNGWCLTDMARAFAEALWTGSWDEMGSDLQASHVKAMKIALGVASPPSRPEPDDKPATSPRLPSKEDIVSIIQAHIRNDARGMNPAYKYYITGFEAAADAILAGSTPAPAAPGPLWRHLKRGTIYREVGRAALQASTRLPQEGEEIVVYQSELGGQLWARAASEFEDGRFERQPDLSASPHGAMQTVRTRSVLKASALARSFGEFGAPVEPPFLSGTCHMLTNKWLQFGLSALIAFSGAAGSLDWTSVMSSKTALGVAGVTGALKMVLNAVAPAAGANLTPTGGALITHTTAAS